MLDDGPSVIIGLRPLTNTHVYDRLVVFVLRAVSVWFALSEKNIVAAVS